MNLREGNREASQFPPYSSRDVLCLAMSCIDSLIHGVWLWMWKALENITRISNPASVIPISSPFPTRRCIALDACPYGYFGDPVKACTCSPGIVTKYQKRISGALLDRIDIHIEVPRVEYDKLSEQRLGEPSAAIQKRVEAARQRQRERFSAAAQQLSDGSQDEPAPFDLNGSVVQCNADMHSAEVRPICDLDETSRAQIRSAMSQLQLSARAYHQSSNWLAPSLTWLGVRLSSSPTWRRHCSID
jgi:hypothetical protein